MFHGNPLPNMQQAKRNRLPLARRARTAAQTKLHKLGITQRDIAAVTGVSAATVNRVLSLASAHRVAFGDVMRVRLAAERLLLEKGVTLTSYDLWFPYDCGLYTPQEAVIKRLAVAPRGAAA